MYDQIKTNQIKRGEGDHIEDVGHIISRSQPNESIGVVLGAGAARGFAHVHVVAAFDDLGLKPAAIVGSSMGSIIGAGWAAGMDGQQMSDYAIDLWGRGSTLMNRIWQKKGRKIGSWVVDALGFRQFDAIEAMRVLLPDGLPEKFDALHIPLSVVATDFYAHETCIFRSGPLFPAIAASAALPGVFRPVLYEGRYLIDGGIMDPVPVSHLPKVDYSIAIDVIGGPMPKSEKDPGSIEIMLGSHQLILQSVIQNQITKHPPNLFFQPDVSRFNALNFFKARQVIEATRPLRDDVKRKVDAMLSAKAA